MKKLLPIVLLLAISLSGCGREVDDTAYVVAIGVDRADTDYDFTFAIANPDVIAAEDGEGKPLMFIAVSGKDIFSACEKAEGMIGEMMNLSHSEVIVFSSAVAGEGTDNLTSSLLRNLRQRPKIIPIVAEGEAGETVRAISSDIEGNPERYLAKLLEGKDGTSIRAMDSRKVLARMKSRFYGTVVPCVAVSDNSIRVSAISLMKDGKEVGKTDDIYSAALIMGSGDTVSFSVLGGSLRLKQRAKPEVSVNYSPNPIINIKIPLTATLQALPEGVSREEMTDVCVKEISRDITELLQYSAFLGADVFALGKYAGRDFLTLSAFADYNWRDKYKTATFNVSVEISFSGTSLVKGDKR